ncbi:MAG TPA: PAS domain-containing sensor histidine kinase [Ramlibacter sp.]
MHPSETEPPPGTDALITLWSTQARDHAVIVLDPEGTIVDWRGAAEEMLGFAPSEAIGRHFGFFFTPEDRTKGYPEYELTAAAQDRYSEDSRWHLRKDGTRIWVSGTTSAVRSPGGGTIGFVKILRDRTDQREQIDRTENRVHELDDARRKVHTFLRTLGHEIRNPLAVLSNLHMILARLNPDERAQKALGQFANQLAVLKKIADDLMDVSRLELGKVQLELKVLDLRELLQSGVDSMQSAASAKQITLQSIFPASPLMVEVDAARMQQVVLNLLGNAVKYTHAGGSIWVRATEEGHDIVCRVQDTGIGIFPPVLPRIFELFAQAPEARDISGGGIGVGLALVRQIVELHGGTVQARSPGIGKGSEFSFRLPSAAAVRERSGGRAARNGAGAS